MDLLKTIEDFVRFKTITGNAEEINKCLAYIADSFKGTDAVVRIERFENASPVIFVANNNDMEQDALVLGHVDVVPAPDYLFEPVIKDGIIYGRGTLDMKAFVAVAMNTMHYVLEHKLPVKFAMLFSTDEETSSASTHAFMAKYPTLSAKVVLDNDVGGDITQLINKCKNPVYFKLTAKGKPAHGSTPWEGLDANEMLMRTIANLRRVYPYFDVNTGKPADTWIDTMHVARLNGGDACNIIAGSAEALLAFRLTEYTTPEDVAANIKKACEEGVSYELTASTNAVVMREDNPQIAAYKKFAEKVLGRKIKFAQMGGATDARLFAAKGATVIMHSGTGEGMHGDNEYLVLKSVEELAALQIEYLKSLA